MHSNDAALARPAAPGTQTMSLTATSSCNVEKASPFDQLRAEEERRKAARPASAWAKNPARRVPRRKTPRPDIKTPVNVPTEVGNYRAELCAWASWLPPHLASVMKGAVCASDVGGEPVHTSRETIAAYTHTPGIQQRYKCKPVSLWQVEHNLPTLARMNLLTTSSRKFYDAWDRKFKTEFLLEITDDNIQNLEAVYRQEVAAKAARDAGKAGQKAASDDRRNRYKREKRARQTAVEDEASNSWHTPDDVSGPVSGPVSGAAHITYVNQIVPSKNVPNSSSRGPDDVGHDSSSKEHRRGQASRTPQNRDESWNQAKEWLAGHLGVSPAEIGWNAFHLADDLAQEYDEDVLAAAAQHCQYHGVNRVAYFVRSAGSLCARTAAEQQAREAMAQHAAEAAEAKDRAERERKQREAEAAAKRRAEREQRVIENRIVEFAYTARRAREQADEERAAEDEFNQRLPKYAELHGYGLDAAREASDAWGTTYVLRLKFINNAISLKELDAERAFARARYLAYVCEHASQERPVKTHEVADQMGVPLAVAIGFEYQLAQDGLIVRKVNTCYPADSAQEAK